MRILLALPRRASRARNHNRPLVLPVFDHLYGPYRGLRQPLTAETIQVGIGGTSGLQFPPSSSPRVAERHATLERQGDTYLLIADPPAFVSVNGEEVQSATLGHGDVIRFGREGPVVRFRMTTDKGDRYKRVGDTMRDCLDGVRLEHDNAAVRAGALLVDAPKQLLTQTSPVVRWSAVAAFALALVAIVMLALRTAQLEQQLADQQDRYEAISALAARAEESALTMDELRVIEERLSNASERLELLEARSQAGERIVAAASHAIAFVMGSYGFQLADGRPLRIAVGAGGLPLRDESGNPKVTPEGAGPLLESQFTGTAFVATEAGLLLTNRHVVLPWEFNPWAVQAMDQGLIPVMHRLIGYLPGFRDPFEIELIAASETADLAVLRCDVMTGKVSPLKLADSEALPGESVFLLGYPTGIKALLARSDRSLVDSLMSDKTLDFWSTAGRLSRAGHIAPLATRGIVGQVSTASIVYDAETTHGGSGGPVLDLNGEVQAVNAAVLTDFGGSNIGVPVAQARQLLALVEESD